MTGLVEISRSFRAMSTGIEAIICVPETKRSESELALNRVQVLFDEMEKRLSRFSSDSELSRLNQSAGQKFKASPLLYEIVAAAVNSARLTGGIFDPTILHYLISAGYDRSFELLNIPRKAPGINSKPYRYTWNDVQLDPMTFSIYLPEGCSIDLGGIAKGWTLDRSGRYLGDFENFAVCAGGDIVVKGNQANGFAWTAGIEDPLNRKPFIGVLKLSDEAICTSTITQRQWKINNDLKHHLINPRTGFPSDSGVISATVIAGTAVLAETLSKAALILGPQHGICLIEKLKPARGMLVMQNGRRLYSSGFPKQPRTD